MTNTTFLTHAISNNLADFLVSQAIPLHFCRAMARELVRMTLYFHLPPHQTRPCSSKLEFHGLQTAMTSATNMGSLDQIA